MAKDSEVAVAEKREIVPVGIDWNGWSFEISQDGRQVNGSKTNPHAGEDGQPEKLRVRTTSTGEVPATDVALVTCMAAAADEDARTAGDADRAAYWNAFHRLYRQATKVSRGDELTSDELLNREQNRRIVAEHNAARGDDPPGLLTEEVD